MTVENPVVIVTSHRVAPGQKDTFVISANSMLSMASRSRGYLGGDLVEPSSDNSVWQIVCRFDTADAAYAWQTEASRSVWAGVLDRCAQHIERSPDKRPQADTDRPAAPAPRAKQAKPAPPPRWKMAVLTLIAVFPAVLGTNVLVVPQLTGLSLIPRTLVLSLIVTALATWLLMKLLGPRFRSGNAPPRGATAEPREVQSDDTIPIAISPPSPAPPPDTGRSRHRAPSQRGRRQPPKAATSPGRQVSAGRK